MSGWISIPVFDRYLGLKCVYRQNYQWRCDESYRVQSVVESNDIFRCRPTYYIPSQR